MAIDDAKANNKPKRRSSGNCDRRSGGGGGGEQTFSVRFATRRAANKNNSGAPLCGELQKPTDRRLRCEMKKVDQTRFALSGGGVGGGGDGAAIFGVLIGCMLALNTTLLASAQTATTTASRRQK